MAKGKKSFVLYADLIHTVNKLPDDKAGELFKHILNYVNDNDPETDDIILQIAFEPIKQQLKRDLVKYGERAGRSRENGSKGGRPRKQKEPKKPTGLNNNPDEPRKPDNVNVNVSVNDSVNVSEINKEETVFSEKDEKFQLFLCDKFGVNEIKQPRHYMNIVQAIDFMNGEGEEINRHFRDQCFYYFKYKELAEEKKHTSVSTFLFDKEISGYRDSLMGGGWNKCNWLELGQSKFKSKYYEDGITPEDVLNSYK